MTFALIAGDATKRRSAATPRHWLVAFVFFIVAQWIVQTLSNAVYALPALFPTMPGVAGMFQTQASMVALLLASQIAGFGVLGSAAVAFSKRVDGRGLGALGLGPEAAPGFALWALAGIIAAIPVVTPLPLMMEGWTPVAAQGAAVLFPVLLIQTGAEEILFRGILLASLAARYGALRGLLISASLFALWHVQLGQPLPDLVFRAGTTLIFGITAGLLVLRQGHLGGAIALHLFWNLALAMSAGLQGWPESFWDSLVIAYFYDAAMTAWDFEEVNHTLLPLIIETVIVLLATKPTLLQILSEGARPAPVS